MSASERELRRLIEKENVNEDDCYNSIRILALVMLELKHDMRWIKTLLMILLTAMIGLGSMQVL